MSLLAKKSSVSSPGSCKNLYTSIVVARPPLVSLMFRTVPRSVGPPAATKALNAVLMDESVKVPLLSTSPKMLTLMVRARSIVTLN